MEGQGALAVHVGSAPIRVASIAEARQVLASIFERESSP